MKILTKITNVTRRFKALRRKNSIRKINNIIYKGSLQQKLRTAKFLTRSNPFQRISTLSTDLLCYNLFSSKLCRYYSDISNDKGQDSNNDSTGGISDKKVIVSFPSKFEPKMLNYVKIPWTQSSKESYIVGAVMPQNYSKQNDTKQLCQLVLDNNLSADKLECVKVSLVPVYYGECNAQTLNNEEAVVPLCQRDKNIKLNQYFNSKVSKLSVSSMMVDVEFNLPKANKNQTDEKNLLDAATPLTFKTVTEGEINLNKRNISENISKDRIDIESLISAIVSRITSAAIKKAHAQTKIMLKSREDLKQTMPTYEPKQLPLKHVPNLPIGRSSESINSARVEQVAKPMNNNLQNLTTAYTLDGTQQSKVAKDGSSITPSSSFVATINQVNYKTPPTLNNALHQLQPKKVNAVETAELPSSSVFLDCFAIFKKKGKEESLSTLFKDKKRGKFLQHFGNDKEIHNLKSELNINMGVMGGSTLEPPLKEIFVSKTQERNASTCKGSNKDSDKGSGKGSICPPSKKADSKNAQGKDSKTSVCQAKSQKGVDNKGSKSSICGSAKKGDSGNKGSKSSICGSSDKKAADKKGSKSSICGSAKKSTDSKTSVCGSAKKGGDKKSSVCGPAKKGGDKKSSVCGPSKKGGDNKSSVCGPAKKGGDKKSSVCGPAKKDGDKKSSVCGPAKKGGDNKGSKSSICGPAKKGGDNKGSKSSVCGGNKSAADKKGSKTSICGSGKKGGDKKDSKSNICGSGKKGSSSACPPRKKPDTKNIKRKGSKSPICATKSQKGGDKGSVCGPAKKGDSGNKASKTSICGSSGKKDSKSSVCGPAKKAADKKDSKSSVCGPAKKSPCGPTQKCGSGGDKKDSKSSVCGPAKKGGDNKGSKTSICGSDGKKGADKKGSKTSVCGPAKKGGDKKGSKSSICGPAKKGGADKKGSICGSGNKGGADKKGSKTSICGSGNKGGADKKGSKTSICGSGNKGGADKKGSKTSICGSGNKGGADKKGSICGSSNKGGADKKGSKSSVCGPAKKGGDKKSSVCGPSKKGSDAKKGSKSSVCGPSKKSADKKGSKSSICGSSKKGADKKGSKSSICGSNKPTKNNKPGSEIVEAICIVRPPIEVPHQENTEKKPPIPTCSSESSNTILIDLTKGIKLKIDNIEIDKVKFNERASKDYLSDKTSMIITIQLPKQNFPSPFPKSGVSSSNDTSMKNVKNFSTMSNSKTEIIEKCFIDKNLNEIIVKIIKEETTA